MSDKYDYMVICGNCGQWHMEIQHVCPEALDLPAEDRKPSNYGNLVNSLLSRGDKEQLDRIEAKLDRLLGEQDE